MALTVGIVLMAAFGLTGVIAALLVSSLADVIVVMWLSHRWYLRNLVFHWEELDHLLRGARQDPSHGGA